MDALRTRLYRCPNVLADGASAVLPRLRRHTPREKAKDEGAFDAAVTVRRPALIGTSAALGEALGVFGAGRADRRARQAEDCRTQGEPPLRRIAMIYAAAAAYVPPLQVDCAVGEWSGWSECDTATGRQERTRPIVMRPSLDGGACPALDDATNCAVACVLGAWAPWGECSASCGGGRRMRRRAVDFPAKNGGEACGSTDEADACNTAACVMQQARTA
jgi:hypothetical protein